ncbi:hypothetical protein DYI41_19465 [Marinobacter salarius]|jgi:hypothetical protein|nr:hypothetical protein [Marinobacter salarius]
MLDGESEQVAHGALDRLGIEWLRGTATAAYQQGVNHILANTIVRVIDELKPNIAFVTIPRLQDLAAFLQITIPHRGTRPVTHNA